MAARPPVGPRLEPAGRFLAATPEQALSSVAAWDALRADLIRWVERARRELRGAGESSPNRGPDAQERLTPHERGIARPTWKALDVLR